MDRRDHQKGGDGIDRRGMLKCMAWVGTGLARSTAFPQGEPGKAESPGPVKNLAADKLRSVLGLTQVIYKERNSSLAVTDPTLG
jgi:hypothetical protein